MVRNCFDSYIVSRRQDGDQNNTFYVRIALKMIESEEMQEEKVNDTTEKLKESLYEKRKVRLSILNDMIEVTKRAVLVIGKRSFIIFYLHWSILTSNVQRLRKN